MSSAKATKLPERAKFPIGYRRKGFPEVLTWGDVVKASERTDMATRQLRTDFPEEFPEPVQVTASGPLYLAREVHPFLAAHPRRRVIVDDDLIRQIQSLCLDEGMTQQAVAQRLGISKGTVQNWVRSTRR